MKPNEMVANSTPIKTNTSTTLPFTTTQRYRVESCSAMADEMGKYIIGPMPPSDFLSTFFPEDDLPLTLCNVTEFFSGCYNEVIKSDKEKNAYEPFVRFFFRLHYLVLISYI
jgi:hypothetical protein